MVFLILLIVVAFFALLIFINVKISNLKYRAKQQVLKNTGISSSEINAGIVGNMEKKHLESFLQEHPEFTEQKIKDVLKQYTTQLFDRNPSNEFRQEICEKIQTDSKLSEMQTMEFKRAYITYYGNQKLNALVIYTDGKDEYNIYLYCNIFNNTLQLYKYQITKGAVVGF